jgi:hypothetical protein|tara:strand:- start:257 stop:430 length:174 start_codon:yes stop_codon:yes gene_type:complete
MKNIKEEIDAILNASTDKQILEDRINYTLFELKAAISDLTECVNRLTDAVDTMKEAS